MYSIGDEDIDDSGATGDLKIDGLLDQYHWSLYAQGIFSFAITDSYADYEDSREGLIDDYPDSNAEEVFAMPTAMVNGIRFAATQFETIVTFSFDEDPNAQGRARIRYGITDFTNEDKKAPAYAYVPDDEDGITDIDTQNWLSGDVFFNEDNFTTANPQVGTYEYHTILHETGHAFGLKHGHESEEFDNDDVRAALPAGWDSMEFSVMTYRSYVGDDLNKVGTVDRVGYSNAFGHYAQTLMQLDIAALQAMYGADHTTQKGDTTYSWDATGGSYSINGATQWTPAADVVFMTIWDGDGIDTYDFSTYATAINGDLKAGGYLNLGTQIAQLEVLDDGTVTQRARANVFNAFLHEGDTRSLIENVVTGRGADRISGNEIANRIATGANDDIVYGLAGDDTLFGGAGGDLLNGGAGRDMAEYSAAGGETITIAPIGARALGRWSVTGSVEGAGDTLAQIEAFRFGEGSDRITVSGTAPIELFGEGGDDTLTGANGFDLLVGGRGTDTFAVRAGTFEVYGGAYDKTAASAAENDLLIINRSAFSEAYTLYVDVPNSGVFYDFDDSVAYGIERIQYTGGAADDNVAGGSGADRFTGGGGRNLFYGYSGNDVASGSGTFRLGLGHDAATGAGTDDFLAGESGNDTLSGGAGTDLIYGGAGNDFIRTGRGGDIGIEGESGNDTIIGDIDDEDLNGGTGDDSLSGDDGKDFLTGGAGADTLDGGRGDDVLIAGAGKIVALGGAGFDELSIDRSLETAGRSFSLDGRLGNDRSRAVSVEELAYSGGRGADTVTGGAGIDDIHGGLGGDRLDGGGERDFLYGDSGADTLIGGAGRDALDGGAGLDRFVFRANFGDDTIADFDSNAAGGQDRLDFTAFNFRNFADLRADVTITGSTTTFLTFASGDALTLSGVAAATITAADFIL